MSLHIHSTIIVIVDSVISKQITIKKGRQRTRNNTVQWQTTVKDKKIQTFQ